MTAASWIWRSRIADETTICLDNLKKYIKDYLHHPAFFIFQASARHHLLMIAKRPCSWWPKPPSTAKTKQVEAKHKLLNPVVVTTLNAPKLSSFHSLKLTIKPIQTKTCARYSKVLWVCSSHTHIATQRSIGDFVFAAAKVAQFPSRISIHW